MTYRTNAQGAVMSSMDGRIWTRLPHQSFISSLFRLWIKKH